ncbi:hypothetical protein DWX58_06800 [Pseudoflavonifractor sp. AF19-9AC]|uniref:PIG-L family deacetylase n=1 Tax=Pseudoflavonifractor sp. AF19-9AC TaxID=2292244 RepID=UPI000E4A5F2C|nr:PIG-L family deacetylase [Pseudoflavonifractor sp. AF19-9AC]RHR10180.1 hypothetical protein DWX58_06800 [Pseudoflavonifractor sp. AF19-9AC]
MRWIVRRIAILSILLACCTLPALAAEAQYGDALMEAEGFSRSGNLYDGSRTNYASADGPATVTVTREGGIAGLYVEFDRIPQSWTLTAPETGESLSCGTNGFLHEYVDMADLGDALPTQVVLEFDQGASIGEIYVFSEGELPDWVQRWELPCEQADLLLISSHSDDEQLFFAGILPYYTLERELNVQVAYVVQHFEANGAADHTRPHEQLDGLWTVGVRHYPVMSQFPDLYAESSNREAALSQALSVYERAGYTYEDFVNYLTWCIRRFQPLVVVSHDQDGEYGHGTHVLCADALGTALTRAADPTYLLATDEAYDPWQVEKTYLHLYPEQQITMDWDTPLESLGGKTPFQMTQEGFACHKSQHWTWFYRWIYGTSSRPIQKAADITSYSPCLYGLYDTKVGPDVVGGDFFENMPSYAQRAQAEAERLAQEQAEAERQAQLAQEQAEAERQAQQQLQEALEAQQRLRTMVKAGVLVVWVCVMILIVRQVLRRRKR